MNYAQRVEWLKQYQQSLKRERELNEELIQLETQAAKCTSAITGMPHGSDGSDKMAIVDKIVETELQIAAEIGNGLECRQEISSAIMGLTNNRQQEILRRRYILGQRWEEIAWKMYLDYNWIWRQHREGVENLTIKSNV